MLSWFPIVVGFLYVRPSTLDVFEAGVVFGWIVAGWMIVP